MPTHEEWVGVIAQAVHAANVGDPQELHRLASLLEAQEAPGVEDVLPSPLALQAPQGVTGMATWRTKLVEDEAAAEEGR